MIRTLKLKLVLSEEQKGSLLRTMELYTEAFDHAARWGYRNQVCNKYTMHHATYRGIRSDIPNLSAALVQSATRAACDRLRQVKLKSIPRRKKYSAIRLPWKEARLFLDSGQVSLTSIDGRIRAHLCQSEYSRSYSAWRTKSSMLVYDGVKTFYLNVSLEKDSPPKKVGEVLGIDRGLRNAAVCSNNMFFNSLRINSVRGRYAWKRAELQAVGTRSAKKKLKKLSGRERRFTTCENHRISKLIVNTDFAVFTLEDLSGIARNRFIDKRMRTKLHQWAHYQLETFIRYKAEGCGKMVIKVDPTMTSQTCSGCGWIDRNNRNGQQFHCVKCGFSLNADLNASRNIARLGKSEVGRLHANQPIATGDDGDHSGVHSKVLNLVTSL